ncbi:scabin-related ADP-ribosyltransferase [Mycobacterium simiae]|uniref:scabin-related ADP-ribosyltransferase n=1 Tax=Mycobacterium simiae TaxID=1784 RepID=UPI003F5DCF13
MFRYDTRPPDIIFDQGFATYEPLVPGYYQPMNFLSTARHPNIIVNFLGEEDDQIFLYTLDAPGGIDLNATSGLDRDEYQQEIAFPGGIRRENIVGAQEVLQLPVRSDDPSLASGARLAELQPNPHFDPDRPNEARPAPLGTVREDSAPSSPASSSLEFAPAGGDSDWSSDLDFGAQAPSTSRHTNRDVLGSLPSEAADGSPSSAGGQRQLRHTVNPREVSDSPDPVDFAGEAVSRFGSDFFNEPDRGPTFAPEDDANAHAVRPELARQAPPPRHGPQAEGTHPPARSHADIDELSDVDEHGQRSGAASISHSAGPSRSHTPSTDMGGHGSDRADESAQSDGDAEERYESDYSEDFDYSDELGSHGTDERTESDEQTDSSTDDQSDSSSEAGHDDHQEPIENPTYRLNEDARDWLRNLDGASWTDVSNGRTLRLGEVVPQRDWWRIYTAANDHGTALAEHPDDPGRLYDSQNSPGFQADMENAYRSVLDVPAELERRIDWQEYQRMFHMVTASARTQAEAAGRSHGFRLTDSDGGNSANHYVGMREIADDVWDERIGGRPLLTDTDLDEMSDDELHNMVVHWSLRHGNPLLTTAYRADRVPDLVNQVFDRYYQEIGAARSEHQTLSAIARAVRTLHMMHPFHDGSGRLNVYFLLPRLLQANGFRPTNMPPMTHLFSGGFSVDEIATALRWGQSDEAAALLGLPELEGRAASDERHDSSEDVLHGLPQEDPDPTDAPLVGGAPPPAHAHGNVEPQRTTASTSEPKSIVPGRDTSKPAEPKADDPKADEPKVDEPKAGPPKADEPKPEPPNAGRPKADEPEVDPPKADEPGVDEAKAKPPNDGPSKVEPAKAGPPKVDEPKAEPPKADPVTLEEPDEPEPDPQLPARIGDSLTLGGIDVIEEFNSDDAGLKHIEGVVRDLGGDEVWAGNREQLTALFSDDGVKPKAAGMLRGGQRVSRVVNLPDGRRLTISLELDGASDQSTLHYKEDVGTYEFEHTSDSTNTVGAFAEWRDQLYGVVQGNIGNSKVSETAAATVARVHDAALTNQRADRQISGGQTAEPGTRFHGKIKGVITYRLTSPAEIRTHDVSYRTKVVVPTRDVLDRIDEHADEARDTVGPLPGEPSNVKLEPSGPPRVHETHALNGSDVVTNFWLLPDDDVSIAQRDMSRNAAPDTANQNQGQPGEHEQRTPNPRPQTIPEFVTSEPMRRAFAKAYGDRGGRLAMNETSSWLTVELVQANLHPMTNKQPLVLHFADVPGAWLEVHAFIEPLGTPSKTHPPAADTSHEGPRPMMRATGKTKETEFHFGTETDTSRVRQDVVTWSAQLPTLGRLRGQGGSDIGQVSGGVDGTFTRGQGQNETASRQLRVRSTLKNPAPGQGWHGQVRLRFEMHAPDTVSPSRLDGPFEGAAHETRGRFDVLMEQAETDPITDYRGKEVWAPPKRIWGEPPADRNSISKSPRRLLGARGRQNARSALTGNQPEPLHIPRGGRETDTVPLRGLGSMDRVTNLDLSGFHGMLDSMGRRAHGNSGWNNIRSGVTSWYHLSRVRASLGAMSQHSPLSRPGRGTKGTDSFTANFEQLTFRRVINTLSSPSAELTEGLAETTDRNKQTSTQGALGGRGGDFDDGTVLGEAIFGTNRTSRDGERVRNQERVAVATKFTQPMAIFDGWVRLDGTMTGPKATVHESGLFPVEIAIPLTELQGSRTHDSSLPPSFTRSVPTGFIDAPRPKPPRDVPLGNPAESRRGENVSFVADPDSRDNPDAYPLTNDPASGAPSRQQSADSTTPLIPHHRATVDSTEGAWESWMPPALRRSGTVESVLSGEGTVDTGPERRSTVDSSTPLLGERRDTSDSNRQRQDSADPPPVDTAKTLPPDTAPSTVSPAPHPVRQLDWTEPPVKDAPRPPEHAFREGWHPSDMLVGIDPSSALLEAIRQDLTPALGDSADAAMAGMSDDFGPNVLLARLTHESGQEWSHDITVLGGKLTVKVRPVRGTDPNDVTYVGSAKKFETDLSTESQASTGHIYGEAVRQVAGGRIQIPVPHGSVSAQLTRTRTLAPRADLGDHADRGLGHLGNVDFPNFTAETDHRVPVRVRTTEEHNLFRQPIRFEISYEQHGLAKRLTGIPEAPQPVRLTGTFSYPKNSPTATDIRSTDGEGRGNSNRSVAVSRGLGVDQTVVKIRPLIERPPSAHTDAPVGARQGRTAGEDLVAAHILDSMTTEGTVVFGDKWPAVRAELAGHLKTMAVQRGLGDYSRGGRRVIDLKSVRGGKVVLGARLDSMNVADSEAATEFYSGGQKSLGAGVSDVKSDSWQGYVQFQGDMLPGVDVLNVSAQARLTGGIGTEAVYARTENLVTGNIFRKKVPTLTHVGTATIDATLSRPSRRLQFGGDSISRTATAKIEFTTRESPTDRQEHEVYAPRAGIVHNDEAHGHPNDPGDRAAQASDHADVDLPPRGLSRDTIIRKLTNGAEFREELLKNVNSLRITRFDRRVHSYLTDTHLASRLGPMTRVKDGEGVELLRHAGVRITGRANVRKLNFVRIEHKGGNAYVVNDVTRALLRQSIKTREGGARALFGPHWRHPSSQGSVLGGVGATGRRRTASIFNHTARVSANAKFPRSYAVFEGSTSVSLTVHYMGRTRELPPIDLHGPILIPESETHPVIPDDLPQHELDTGHETSVLESKPAIEQHGSQHPVTTKSPAVAPKERPAPDLVRETEEPPSNPPESDPSSAPWKPGADDELVSPVAEPTHVQPRDDEGGDTPQRLVDSAVTEAEKRGRSADDGVTSDGPRTATSDGPSATGAGAQEHRAQPAPQVHPTDDRSADSLPVTREGDGPTPPLHSRSELGAVVEIDSASAGFEHGRGGVGGRLVSGGVSEGRGGVVSHGGVTTPFDAWNGLVERDSGWANELLVAARSKFVGYDLGGFDEAIKAAYGRLTDAQRGRNLELVAEYLHAVVLNPDAGLGLLGAGRGGRGGQGNAEAGPSRARVVQDRSQHVGVAGLEGGQFGEVVGEVNRLRADEGLDDVHESAVERVVASLEEVDSGRGLEELARAIVVGLDEAPPPVTGGEAGFVVGRVGELLQGRGRVPADAGLVENAHAALTNAQRWSSPADRAELIAGMLESVQSVAAHSGGHSRGPSRSFANPTPATRDAPGLPVARTTEPPADTHHPTTTPDTPTPAPPPPLDDREGLSNLDVAEYNRAVREWLDGMAGREWPEVSRRDAVRLGDVVGAEHWWRLYIDPQHHAAALRRGDPGSFYDDDKSPGFQANMQRAFEMFLNDPEKLEQRVDWDEYSEMHWEATRGISGGDFEIADVEDHPIFHPIVGERPAADLLTEQVGGRPLVTMAPADVDQYDPLPAGVGEDALVTISSSWGDVPVIRPELAEYQVPRMVDAVFDDYYDDIAAAQTERDRLRAIGRVVRNLHVMHPHNDGNGRLNINLLLPRLLLANGFAPVITHSMADLFSGGFSRDQIATALRWSQDRDLTQGLDDLRAAPESHSRPVGEAPPPVVADVPEPTPLATLDVDPTSRNSGGERAEASGSLPVAPDGERGAWDAVLEEKSDGVRPSAAKGKRTEDASDSRGEAWDRYVEAHNARGEASSGPRDPEADIARRLELDAARRDLAAWGINDPEALLADYRARFGPPVAPPADTARDAPVAPPADTAREAAHDGPVVDPVVAADEAGHVSPVGGDLDHEYGPLVGAKRVKPEEADGQGLPRVNPVFYRLSDLPPLVLLSHTDARWHYTVDAEGEIRIGSEELGTLLSDEELTQRYVAYHGGPPESAEQLEGFRALINGQGHPTIAVEFDDTGAVVGGNPRSRVSGEIWWNAEAGQWEVNDKSGRYMSEKVRVPLPDPQDMRRWVDNVARRLSAHLGEPVQGRLLKHADAGPAQPAPVPPVRPEDLGAPVGGRGDQGLVDQPAQTTNDAAHDGPVGPPADTARDAAHDAPLAPAADTAGEAAHDGPVVDPVVAADDAVHDVPVEAAGDAVDDGPGEVLVVEQGGRGMGVDLLPPVVGDEGLGDLGVLSWRAEGSDNPLGSSVFGEDIADQVGQLGRAEDDPRRRSVDRSADEASVSDGVRSASSGDGEPSASGSGEHDGSESEVDYGTNAVSRFPSGLWGDASADLLLGDDENGGLSGASDSRSASDTGPENDSASAGFEHGRGGVGGRLVSGGVSEGRGGVVSHGGVTTPFDAWNGLVERDSGWANELLVAARSKFVGYDLGGFDEAIKAAYGRLTDAQRGRNLELVAEYLHAVVLNPDAGLGLLGAGRGGRGGQGNAEAGPSRARVVQDRSQHVGVAGLEGGQFGEVVGEVNRLRADEGLDDVHESAVERVVASLEEVDSGRGLEELAREIVVRLESAPPPVTRSEAGFVVGRVGELLQGRGRVPADAGLVENAHAALTNAQRWSSPADRAELIAGMLEPVQSVAAHSGGHSRGPSRSFANPTPATRHAPGLPVARTTEPPPPPRHAATISNTPTPAPPTKSKRALGKQRADAIDPPPAKRPKSDHPAGDLPTSSSSRQSDMTAETFLKMLKKRIAEPKLSAAAIAREFIPQQGANGAEWVRDKGWARTRLNLPGRLAQAPDYPEYREEIQRLLNESKIYSSELPEPKTQQKYTAEQLVKVLRAFVQLRAEGYSGQFNHALEARTGVPSRQILTWIRADGSPTGRTNFGSLPGYAEQRENLRNAFRELGHDATSSLPETAGPTRSPMTAEIVAFALERLARDPRATLTDIAAEHGRVGPVALSQYVTAGSGELRNMSGLTAMPDFDEWRESIVTSLRALDLDEQADNLPVMMRATDFLDAFSRSRSQVAHAIGLMRNDHSLSARAAARRARAPVVAFEVAVEAGPNGPRVRTQDGVEARLHHLRPSQRPGLTAALDRLNSQVAGDDTRHGRLTAVSVGGSRWDPERVFLVENEAVPGATRSQLGDLYEDNRALVRGPRSYADDRGVQVLRWMSTALREHFAESGEVQAYFDREQQTIYVSSNTNVGNRQIREALEQPDLSNLWNENTVENDRRTADEDAAARATRHQRKLRDALTSLNNHDDEVSREILQAIRDRRFVVPTESYNEGHGRTLDLHAERRIYEMLRANNRTMDLTLLAGTMRACGDCADALGFDDARPRGPFWRSRAAGAFLNTEATIARNSRDGVPSHVTGTRRDRVTNKYNTESDSDHRDNAPKKHRKRK